MSNYSIAVPLTSRDMNWERLTETVIRMDGAVRRIGAEPPWMGSRRVSARGYQFMSRVNRNTPNPATSPVASYISFCLWDSTVIIDKKL